MKTPRRIKDAAVPASPTPIARGKGCVWSYRYSNPPDGKEAKLHHVRDGAAVAELTAALTDEGYRYGSALHAYEQNGLPRSEFTRYLEPGDVVLLATRPPKNDRPRPPKNAGPEDTGDRRWIKRSNDHLERAIFRAIQPYLPLVKRATVHLSRKLAAALPPGKSYMAELTFRLYNSGTAEAVYRRRGREVQRIELPKERHVAVGYFLHLGSLPGYSRQRLIVCFSMSGEENLFFARIARVRHPEWFRQPVFAMCEFRMPASTARPLTPAIADGLAHEVLIEQPMR